MYDPSPDVSIVSAATSLMTTYRCFPPHLLSRQAPEHLQGDPVLLRASSLLQLQAFSTCRSPLSSRTRRQIGGNWAFLESMVACSSAQVGSTAPNLSSTLYLIRRNPHGQTLTVHGEAVVVPWSFPSCIISPLINRSAVESYQRSFQHVENNSRALSEADQLRGSGQNYSSSFDTPTLRNVRWLPG
ncbi:hypothetical protein BDV96DRAFT_147361 [Lophiotrema nucula]|uniref:Uncharacterized protein n=1 Tax=Lophiotrema nucula TaxID=690887 RepID=A0A6A5Z1K3_9PLEO|nr:hypothetical protein BDV96DRAFT_147361 [Lophiotrema nucula]